MQSFYTNAMFEPANKNVMFVFEPIEGSTNGMRFRVHKSRPGGNGSCDRVGEFTFPKRSATRKQVAALYAATRSAA